MPEKRYSQKQLKRHSERVFHSLYVVLWDNIIIALSSVERIPFNRGRGLKIISECYIYSHFGDSYFDRIAMI